MTWFTDLRKYYLYRIMIKRMVLPILIVFFLDQGLTLMDIGVITAVSAILSMILEVPSGTVSDVLGHRRSLIFSCFGQAFSMLLFIVLGGFWGMMIASVVYWSAGSFMSGTNEAIFYELLEREKKTDQYKKLFGRAYAWAHGGGIVLLAISSVLYIWNPIIPFIGGILQFLIAAWTISSIEGFKQTQSVAKDEGYVGFFESVKKNRQMLKPSHALFWIIYLEAFTFGVLFAALEFKQVYMEEVGILIVLFGSVYAIERIPTVFSSLIADRLSKHFNMVQLLVWLNAVWIVALLLQGFDFGPWVAVLLILMIRIPFGSMRVLYNDLSNQMLTTGSRSTFLSLLSLIRSATKAIAALLIGVSAGLASIFTTYFWLAIISIGFVMIGLFGLYSTKHPSLLKSS